MRIEGMDCAACALKIENAMLRLPGVTDIRAVVLGRRLHRQVGRLFTSEDAIDKIGCRQDAIARNPRFDWHCGCSCSISRRHRESGLRRAITSCRYVEIIIGKEVCAGCRCGGSEAVLKLGISLVANLYCGEVGSHPRYQ